MGTSVSMCLQVAPHKIVKRIKIRTAVRPAVLRDQVVAVVLKPLDGLVGDMAGGRILRRHPMTISCHCLDPGNDGALHDLQRVVRVDPEASVKDVRGLPDLPGGHRGSWCTGNDLPGVPGLCQSPFLVVHTPAVHNSQISNLAICQNVTLPCQNHDSGAPFFSLRPRNLCQRSET